MMAGLDWIGKTMLEKVQSDRLAKLDQIKALGIDPYGRRYDTARPIRDIVAEFEKWEKEHPVEPAPEPTAAPAPAGQGQPKPQAEPRKDLPRGDAAGRLILIRDMGKMMFVTLRDQTGTMQLALRKNALDETGWKLAKLLDLGDIIAAAGPVERTRTKEVTIWADRLTLLCKSLSPMPEKFHGLSDVETRYRQRYLDLMANPESMATFRKRIDIIDNFRRLLAARGFVEVETPMMQAIYGGAAARPFTTHHNTLDCDLFLRISPELYLKRLLVGGMERVFEIGRNFRNEGLDTRHNPEFTMLELYQAYADYEVMMEITEELVSESAKSIAAARPAWRIHMRHVFEEYGRAQRMLDLAKESPDAEEIPGDLGEAIARANEATGMAFTKALEYQPSDLAIQEGRVVLPFGDHRSIDYTRPWPRKTYGELLQEHAGVSMRDSAAVRAKARALGLEPSNKDDAVVVNEVFELTVEPALAKLDRPMFVVDYPAELCPLTRRKADDPSIALRFECFIAGMEIANAYTELNDPAVQEANFRQQLRGEAAGETMRVMDEDFVTALLHGMPPAGGLGIGIDRVVMLLTNTQSIRDVILFPLLRPQ